MDSPISIEDLQNEIEQLKSEKKSQALLICKLQNMLRTTLKFSERVRNSKLGRFFFRKQIKELDAGSQSSIDDTTECTQLQDFDDIQL